MTSALFGMKPAKRLSKIIKEHLTKTPVLVALISRKSFFI